MSRLHPLQVKGKYYVDNDLCLFCECCVVEAPKNFALQDLAYVFKQPANAKEEKACQRAMHCCPTEAIRDDGDIPEGERSSRRALQISQRNDPPMQGLSSYDKQPVDMSRLITIVIGIVLIFGFLALVTLIGVRLGW